MDKPYIVEVPTCECGYPQTPCNKTKHSYGHICQEAEAARKLKEWLLDKRKD